MRALRVTSAYWLEQVKGRSDDFRIVWATIIAG